MRNDALLRFGSTSRNCSGPPENFRGEAHAQTNGLVAAPAGWLAVEECDFGLWLRDYDPIWAAHPRAWHEAFPSGSPMDLPENNPCL